MALQKMDKKMRSLEKHCGNEFWSKVQKRGPNISTVLVVKITKTRWNIVSGGNWEMKRMKRKNCTLRKTQLIPASICVY